MFREAYVKAAEFTEPVKYFWKSFNGKLGAGLGSLIIVNADGWILTAGHIVQEAAKLAKADRDARDWENRRGAIQSDSSINRKERARQLKALKTPRKKDIIRAAIFWGHHASNLVDVTVLQGVDLAIGRLDPFDPDWVAGYPIFKNNLRDPENGTSLCKFGFPFHDIEPTYDEATSKFGIPPNMRSFPLFPIEGIYTRTIIRVFDVSDGIEEVSDGCCDQIDHGYEGCGVAVPARPCPGRLEQAV